MRWIHALLFLMCSPLAWSQSAWDLCREQIENQSVPVACFQSMMRLSNKGDSAQAMAVFLERKCEQAVKSEKRLTHLVNVSQHPLLPPNCRKAAFQRLERIRYAQQDVKPMEVFESLIDESARY